MKRIYLDNNATTALDPRVLEAMLPHFSSVPANPSSVHYFGQEARKHLSLARKSIADFFNISALNLIFTSGGTESLNMLLRGVTGHVITSDIEHSSVYNTIKQLGCETTYLKTGLSGAIVPAELQAAIKPHTRLIVLSAANSETGVKNDIEQIAQIAQSAQIPFFVDAVACLGKDLFTIPKGVSAMAFWAISFMVQKALGCFTFAVI